MGLRFESLLGLNFNEHAELFNRCFEGYLVPLHLSPEMAAGRIRREGIDLARTSFYATRDGTPVAILVTALRGHKARLAGMGVVKEARGQGVAKECVAEWLRRLQLDGFSLAWLEVFEQNAAAVRVYEAFGFKECGKLFGYSRRPFDERAPGLHEAPMRDYLDALLRSSDRLPWVQEPEQLATTAVPLRSYSVDGAAFALLAPGAPRTIRLTSLFVRPEERGKGKAKELLHAIQMVWNGYDWQLPQLLPENMDAFFTSNGFIRDPLNQIEMSLELEESQ